MVTFVLLLHCKLYIWVHELHGRHAPPTHKQRCPFVEGGAASKPYAELRSAVKTPRWCQQYTVFKLLV